MSLNKLPTIKHIYIFTDSYTSSVGLTDVLNKSIFKEVRYDIHFFDKKLSITHFSDIFRMQCCINLTCI